jgi:hypothetical protein
MAEDPEKQTRPPGEDEPTDPDLPQDPGIPGPKVEEEHELSESSRLVTAFRVPLASRESRCGKVEQVIRGLSDPTGD